MSFEGPQDAWFVHFLASLVRASWLAHPRESHLGSGVRPWRKRGGIRLTVDGMVRSGTTEITTDTHRAGGKVSRGLVADWLSWLLEEV